MTRLGFVVKIRDFFTQNGDENKSRRQNRSFLNQKRWRERVSSSKKWVFYPKVATRTSLVVKIEAFSTQNGDEKGSRRQNWAFLDQKRWRERISSPKLSIPRPKTVTRLGFATKIKLFSTQNGDEKGSRRQKQAFLNQKRRRERGSSSK